MIIKGIGIDLLRIERIEKVVEKYSWAFLKKIYTRNELALLKNRLNKKSAIAELAGRFVAKEAVSKALGVGIRKIGSGPETKRAVWQEMEIINLSSGEPCVNLYGQTLEIAKGQDIARVIVSITHDDYALAIALAL